MQQRAKESDLERAPEIAPGLAATGDDPILVVAPDDGPSGKRARPRDRSPCRRSRSGSPMTWIRTRSTTPFRTSSPRASIADRPGARDRPRLEFEAATRRAADPRRRSAEPRADRLRSGPQTRRDASALREAGVDLALFGRFGRHALRFQINRALARLGRDRAPRGELRAPMPSGGPGSSLRARTKEVRCYSACRAGGAYFVTPRPFVVGIRDRARAARSGGDRLRVAGHACSTRTCRPTHRSSQGLPRGMAVGFRPALRTHVQDVIRRRRDSATHRRPPGLSRYAPRPDPTRESPRRKTSMDPARLGPEPAQPIDLDRIDPGRDLRSSS